MTGRHRRPERFGSRRAERCHRRRMGEPPEPLVSTTSDFARGASETAGAASNLGRLTSVTGFI